MNKTDEESITAETAEKSKPTPKAAPSEKATKEVAAKFSASKKVSAAKEDVKKSDAPAKSKAKAKREAKAIAFILPSKESCIKKHQMHDKDVGSSSVQIALLTDRILHLTTHVRSNPKDKHTNYGLLKLVSRRKKLLNYLENTKPGEHKTLKAALNLR